MLALLDTVPWFIPIFAVSLGLSVALSGPVAARWQRIDRPVAWLLLAAVGLILSATLTPQAAAVERGATSAGQCNMSRVAFASLSEYLAGGEAGGNVVMFFPLGFAIALASRSRSRRAMAIGAVLFPFAIEAVQLLVPGLDRACESGDVIDNLLGLAMGLALGAAADLAIRSRQGHAWADRRPSTDP